jgi:soluble lytic murein transglycosylase
MWLKLVETAGDDDMAAAGLYWAARAAGAAGDAASAASDTRGTAERYPATYYGELAASQTGLPTRVPVADPFPDIPPGAIPSVDRYRELDALAQTQDATEALQAAADGASPSDQPQLTLLLSEAIEKQGQLRSGIGIAEEARALIPGAGRAVPLALWQALYPQGQWTPITQATGRTTVDPYLVAGVIREESRFDPAALSSAGAFGLMQLMPGTARSAARNAGVPPPSSRALADPQTNVLLGTVVLSELLKQFGRVDLALAGYNAGPGAVDRWLAQRPGADPATFVEDIPYPETRGYVKTVMESAAIYRWLYRDGHTAPPAP